MSLTVSPPGRSGPAPLSERAAASRTEFQDEQRLRAARRTAAIDASTRLPVLVYFASALFWLIMGSVLAILASIKLHAPWFFDEASWLTFGRVRPAHLNTMAYGWASMGSVATALWLTARLTRAPLAYPRLVAGSAILWNLGLLAGAIGILTGSSTSVEWLELPPWSAPPIAAAFVIVSVSAFVTFARRTEKHVYVSLWYILAAVLWFPWLYTAANLMMFSQPVSGVPLATLNWWYAHNALGLWFTPVGLAAAYYLIPKVIGRPIYSYALSVIGFWSLALFYNWNGGHHLIGGPVPAWLVTVSIVASVSMIIPVIAVAINHHMTMTSHFSVLKRSPTLRFVVFAAVAYTLTSLQGSMEALREVNRITHFTHYTIGHAHLGLYGFVTMMLFGTMYYAVPRLTGREWASATAARLHFWTCALGVVLYVGALSIGGWIQGMMLNDAETPFMKIVETTIPYLQARSVAGGLMTTGHVIFLGLFIMNLTGFGPRRQGPLTWDERADSAHRGHQLTRPSSSSMSLKETRV